MTDDITRSFYENDDTDIPTEILEIAKTYSDDFLPDLSAKKYEKCYADFKTWQNANDIRSIQEPVFMAYFGSLSETLKPNTLWSRYSMIKKVLIHRENVDISKYMQLISFLKKKAVGYKPHKAMYLSADKVEKFLSTAPDYDYLLKKVSYCISSTDLSRG